MGLEDASDALDGIPGAIEKGGEKKESPSDRAKSKKIQTQIQKIQKDEKKAKGDNDDLFEIFSRFIQDPLYASLIPNIVGLLKGGVPSRFVFILLVFIYPPAIDRLDRQREAKLLPLFQKIKPHHTGILFDEAHLDPVIRVWMNAWIQMWYEWMLDEGASQILRQKLFTLLQNIEQRSRILKTGVFLFVFFFGVRNIEISPDLSRRYFSFIIMEFEKKLRKSIEQGALEDPDFLMESLDDSQVMQALFGVIGSETGENEIQVPQK